MCQLCRNFLFSWIFFGGLVIDVRKVRSDVSTSPIPLGVPSFAPSFAKTIRSLPFILGKGIPVLTTS